MLVAELNNLIVDEFDELDVNNLIYLARYQARATRQDETKSCRDHFKTGRDILKTCSFILMNKIVDLLKSVELFQHDEVINMDTLTYIFSY